jgi:hypothetical protein
MQASWEPVPEGLKRGNELEIAEESDALRQGHSRDVNQ